MFALLKPTRQTTDLGAPWRRGLFVSGLSRAVCVLSFVTQRPLLAGNLRQFRSSVIGAIWGGGRSTRAPEMVMLILSDPTRADPEMAIACETILAFMRLFQSNLQELFRVWFILGPFIEQQSNRGRRPTFPSVASLMRWIPWVLR